MENLPMKAPEFPRVVQHDDGIRPAGQPDTCFYCHSKIGEEHKRDCPVVHKTVRLRFIIEIEREAAYCASEEEILSLYNGSAWCADNVLTDIEDALHKKDSCLCDSFKCEFVRTTNPVPTRHIRHIDTPVLGYTMHMKPVPKPLKTPGVRTVQVYDPITSHGRWPGTDDMLNEGVTAFENAQKNGRGFKETLMAVWNAMVKAHP